MDNWVEKTARCQTVEEFRTTLALDVGELIKRVAMGRALLNALENMSPNLLPSHDRALSRLRAYAVDSHWEWSSERAMAGDLAELVEDMEATLQRNDGERFGYRRVLLVLVADKLDMDRGSAILDAIDAAGEKERESLFRELQGQVAIGWEIGVGKVTQGKKKLDGDPLAGFKLYANMELGGERFIRPASHVIEDTLR